MKIFGVTFQHKKIYFVIILLTAISLPVSKFAISVTMIALIVNYLLEGEFKRKYEGLKQNYVILIFTGIFLIHILWLLNTQNFKYAFNDIGNKAILLLYPIIIGTSEKITIKRFRLIINFFVASLLLSTLISVAILLGLTSINVNDIREISQFMSHIRLSLLVNMGIFSLFYFLYFRISDLSTSHKIIYSSLILWFVVFLFILKSLTGIIIFGVIVGITIVYVSFKLRSFILKIGISLFFILCIVGIGLTIANAISEFYSTEDVDLENLDKQTANGNPYFHRVTDRQIENGNYVWLYINDIELNKEWRLVSELDYNGVDKKDQLLRTTLIRYMSSKGFRKDSLGFSKMTDQDIKNVESGMANYIYQDMHSLKALLYQVIWQVDVYIKGHSPGGNPVTERLEFLKAAKGIIAENFYFGVGTGDVKDSFLEEYDRIESELPLKRRLRAHNQYVTFFLTFGVFGFFTLIFCLFYPFFKSGAYRNYLVVAFMLIALLSFINEDTLENQIGMTFFSYFYSLFIFGSNLFLKGKEKYV